MHRAGDGEGGQPAILTPRVTTWMTPPGWRKDTH